MALNDDRSATVPRGGLLFFHTREAEAAGIRKIVREELEHFERDILARVAIMLAGQIEELKVNECLRK